MARDRLPITLKLYRGSTRVAAPFAGMLLKRRLKRDKEDPARVAERRGIASMRRPRGPLVWMHGASVGEILSLMPLIDRIRANGLSILLTSGTVTAARIAERRLPKGVLHQFVPLDSPAFIHRFLDYWRPGLILLAESELWPNMIMEAAQRGAPIVLINGRVSKRSLSAGSCSAAPPRRCSRTSIFVSRKTAKTQSGSSSSARSGCSRPAISNSTCRRRRPTR